MTTIYFPKARTERLTIRKLQAETLIYDLDNHKVHCLNPVAGLVWRLCDGRRPESELACLVARQQSLDLAEAGEVVQLALEQLVRRKLLQEPVAGARFGERSCRRQVLKKLALAAALPLIATISPQPARAAASGAAGCPAGTCNSNADCPANFPVCLGGTGTGCMGKCVSPESDRNLKEHFAAVDNEAVLKDLAGLSIQKWNYKGESPAIRHLGPMAQDFAAAFGVGEDDRHIHVVDGMGVAFAAIQALYRQVQEQQQEIRSLQRRLRKTQRNGAHRKNYLLTRGAP